MVSISIVYTIFAPSCRSAACLQRPCKGTMLHRHVWRSACGRSYISGLRALVLQRLLDRILRSADQYRSAVCVYSMSWVRLPQSRYVQAPNRGQLQMSNLGTRRVFPQVREKPNSSGQLQEMVILNGLVALRQRGFLVYALSRRTSSRTYICFLYHNLNICM